jgi:hypothetical protein
MSFLPKIASMLPGKDRGVRWAEAMKEIAAAEAATKIAKEAEERAEAAFLSLSEDEQVELVHAAWVVNATPEPVKAKKALVAALLPWAEANLLPKSEDEGTATEVVPKKKRKVVFVEATIKEVPVCLLQSSDTTWKFKKSKFGPDMEYPVGPHMALLRAARLAEELTSEESSLNMWKAADTSM